jgi:predicted RNA methylase
VFDALRAERGPAPVVADLAAGPAPYLLSALTRQTRAHAIVGDTDPEALAAARRDAEALGIADRVQFVQASAFDREALQRLRPSPDVVVELGLFGIYHDDALIQRHFHDLAALVSPNQIVFNVQTRNPEIEHIARVWVNQAGGRCVWRLRPVEQLLEWARDAGYEPATVEADRFDIYRVVRLVREDEAA